MSAGHVHSCAVRTNATVVCWGASQYGETARQAGSFVSVSAGAHHTCAVRTDATVPCWGLGTDGKTTVPAGAFLAITSPASPPPPPPPGPPLSGPAAAFVGSPKSVRVSSTGRFGYRFVATPSSTGTIRLASTKKVKINGKKRTLKVTAKSFTAPADARVKVIFKLSRAKLNALKHAKSLRLKVTVTLAAKPYTTTLKLKAPK